MMILSLFLLLFTSRLLLVTPFVIEKEQVQKSEEPPSLEVNNTTDPKTEAPWTNVEFVIEKEQVQKSEEPPSLEVNNTTDPKTEAPWTNVEKEQVQKSEEPPSLEANNTTDPKTEAPWTNVEFPLEEAEHNVDTCRKVSLYISFPELGLSDEIITPWGFDAFQCKGKCSSTQRKKFPNRSALMALLEKKKGIAIDNEACCVPTKLAPISALVFEKNEQIVLRKFDDLVVEECGCK